MLRLLDARLQDKQMKNRTPTCCAKPQAMVQSGYREILRLGDIAE